MSRDQYVIGHDQGYADNQDGLDYDPGSNDPRYLDGYDDGWEESEHESDEEE
jgi:hypothetical protein